MNLSDATRAETVRRIRARRAVNAARGPAARRVPRQQPPDAIRLEYYNALRAALAPMREAVERELIPELPALLSEVERGDSVRADAPSRRITDLIRKVAKAAAGSIGNGELDRLATKFGERTSEFQKEQLNRQVKAALGIDIYKVSPSMKGKIAEFARENVKLIRSVQSDYFAKVEKVTINAARTGIRHEELAKQIEERFSVSESRAKLIARDQIGKLYGQINEERQRALGIDGYTWRTSGDLRVRDEHAEREGETFKWGELPPDEEPGQPINCRCYAEPDFSAVLASLK